MDTVVLHRTYHGERGQTLGVIDVQLALSVARAAGHLPWYVVMADAVYRHICSEAGIDPDRFGILETYFAALPVIIVSGPTYPIEVVSWRGSLER